MNPEEFVAGFDRYPIPGISRKRRKASVWRARERLWRQQKGLCCYCGMLCLLQPPGQALQAGDATIEHLHPFALGGKDYSNNLMMACLECNNERGKALGKRIKAIRAERYKRRNNDHHHGKTLDI